MEECVGFTSRCCWLWMLLDGDVVAYLMSYVVCVCVCLGLRRMICLEVLSREGSG